MSEIEVFYEGNFSTRCVHKGSGKEVKTQMLEFSPTDLCAASLASCAITILALSAQKKGIVLENINALGVKQMSIDAPRRITSITISIACSNSVPEDLRASLEESVRHCPVHHSLHPDLFVTYHFKWG